MADRQYRGVECGGGLGICLGIAAASDQIGPQGPLLSVAERTEVALDLRESSGAARQRRPIIFFCQMACIPMKLWKSLKPSFWALPANTLCEG